ncbi:MAG: sulfurtransferase TusA family protein, partial [Candidatus Bathyarchaeia archaeon]
MSRKEVLDLKGVVCPWTQIKALEALRRVSPGTVMRIIVDNPTSVEGIVSAAKNAGHKIERVMEEEMVYT